jgi:hypothetical protein
MMEMNKGGWKGMKKNKKGRRNERKEWGVKERK